MANESKLTMLDPKKQVRRYLMILLDMSAPSQDDDGVPVVKDAVVQFIENVGEQEKVAVYAFDGRKELVPILRFEHTGERRDASIERLVAFEPKDNSRNLNGALVAAAATLKAEMDASRKPLALGTLLVLTEGTDRAHRATISEAAAALKDAGLEAYAVALGAEIKPPLRPWVDNRNFVNATSGKALSDAFVAFAVRIKDSASKFYLLSYCAPLALVSTMWRWRPLSARTKVALSTISTRMVLAPIVIPPRRPVSVLPRPPKHRPKMR